MLFHIELDKQKFNLNIESLKDYPTYKLINWLGLEDLTLGEIAHG